MNSAVSHPKAHGSAEKTLSMVKNSSPEPAVPGPLQVLIVDDESLIRWSLSETLADAGHIVIEARDADAAIRSVREADRPFDIVLLDYRLPDSDDLSLLSAIRRLSPGSTVIMMTAFGSPEVVRGALDLGAYRVVLKPFEVDEMAALVAEAHSAGGA